MLDEDGSGYADAGELSRFMRIGKVDELTPAQKSRKEMLRLKEQEAGNIKAQTDLLMEKAATGEELRKKGILPASADEVRELGHLLCVHCNATI